MHITKCSLSLSLSLSLFSLPFSLIHQYYLLPRPFAFPQTHPQACTRLICSEWIPHAHSPPLHQQTQPLCNMLTTFHMHGYKTWMTHHMQIHAKTPLKEKKSKNTNWKISNDLNIIAVVDRTIIFWVQGGQRQFRHHTTSMTRQHSAQLICTYH